MMREKATEPGAPAMTDEGPGPPRPVSDEPLPTTPSATDIEHKQFVAVRRGFDTHEVRTYLRAVARRVQDLEQQLVRATGRHLELEQQLERLRSQVRTLQAERADEQLRHREASSRLELAEALRENALARAVAAEAGRQHAEDLLAGLDAARSSPRGIEQAASLTIETTEAQAERILEVARRNAERIEGVADQLAQLWDIVVGELRQKTTDATPGQPGLRPGSPPSSPMETDTGPAHQPERDLRNPAGAAPGLQEAASTGGLPRVRFTTHQARAAAVALHSSARDDLRLAEFWIQEAEQEASEDAMATSRTILEEARQLLTMASELGHPATDLLAQYASLQVRTRPPKN